MKLDFTQKLAQVRNFGARLATLVLIGIPRMTTARLGAAAIIGGLTITAIAVPTAAAATTTPVAGLQSSTVSTAALPSCDHWSTFIRESRYRVRIPTVGHGTRQWDCVMGVGNQGAGIKILQNALNECYHQGLVVDGKYGSLTEQAVKNVQNFHSIGVDGVYGPETRDAMVFPRKASDGTDLGCWL